MTRRHLLTTTGCCAAGLLGSQPARCEPAARPAARRPRIGIPAVADDNYARVVRAAGGLPEPLAMDACGPAHLDRLLERLDGLLLPGGADIPPAEYGGRAHPSIKLLAAGRCAFEKALGAAWLAQPRRPLLGICLGCQWINVLRGGTLVEDIPSELHVSHRDTTHPVAIEPGSRLHRIFGRAELVVNSTHHQAVREVGRGLRVAARGADGVIEAIEADAAGDPGRFLVGVQWHPERMFAGDRLQQRLLRAFVAAAAGG